MVQRLQTYRDRHGGNSDVPIGYEEDRQLAAWVVSVRQRFQLNRLTKARIDQLTNMDFPWFPSRGKMNQLANEQRTTNASKRAPDSSELPELGFNLVPSSCNRRPNSQTPVPSKKIKIFTPNWTVSVVVNGKKMKGNLSIPRRMSFYAPLSSSLPVVVTPPSNQERKCEPLPPVGQRVAVYWPEDHEFYPAVVLRHSTKPENPNQLYVRYDEEEDKEWVAYRKDRILNLKYVCQRPDNPNIHELHIGSRVSVWWSYEKLYFHGTLTQIRYKENISKPHFIQYDDGDEQWVNLAFRSFRRLEDSMEV